MAEPAESRAYPVDEVLPTIADTLTGRGGAVLVAPPGAGKTTRIPPFLLDQPWLAGQRVIVLEPRRLAARAAAEWMARQRGERVGETVGLRVRMETRISAATRIEVVTEGVFSRMILDDPALDGIGAVIFDEFHERSLDADLGLALALEAQGALRPDLRLLAMSATLDGARVAALLGDAPVIRSEGRAFPVETRYVPREPGRPIADAVSAAVALALRNDEGSCLAFLPGAGEIRRTAERLAERQLPPDVDVVSLHGGLERGEQERAIRPAPRGRRKVVLATAIAETSLTIEGVRVVIDGGLARVPVFEPGIGLTRLATVRVSLAGADQRRGRAGRTAPGVCYRLWEEAATGSLEPFARPEILSADLAPLLLDCAEWGVADPSGLPFLDQPPAPALAEARKLLRSLGALDAEGRITEAGRRLRRLPLPPRLAHMVLRAAAAGAETQAAELAALLIERGLGGDSPDLEERLDRFRRDGSRRAAETRRMAASWAREASVAAPSPSEAPSLGALVAAAYPDRIARARGQPGEFVLANGRGARLEPHLALAREPFLAVAEIAGAAAAARVLAAAPITLAEIEAVAAGAVESVTAVTFDPEARALRARQVRRLGAVRLGERPLPVPADKEAARTFARGIAALGLTALPWPEDVRQLRERVSFLRQAAPHEWPDLTDHALVESIEEWLAPRLNGKTRLDELDPGDLRAALTDLLPWDRQRRLDELAPTHLLLPTGSRVPIDYAAEGGPAASCRVQELFGSNRHPTIANGSVPLVLQLLSPAGRPIQVTRDVPGFWRGSWSAVRAEMRGRYPKHPWPEEPDRAEPTRRAKPRGV